MTTKIVTGKPALLKQINRNIIIKLIIEHGEISRSEISKLTNLALPSVMRLVDGLIVDKLVIDIGKGDSTGGRRPNLITLNKEAMYIIGVEIAIETTILLTDLLGNVIDQWHSDEMSYVTPDEMLHKINETIENILLENNIPREKIAGIGIGTPGTNFKHIRDIEYSILKGWESIDVKAWFEKRTDLKVFVDNVARTRTLSELWFGKGRDLKSFIYVFVDQGVGCGIVNNKSIYTGQNLVAGEFGHNVIQFGGRPCYCGNSGCIEMYVSTGAITNEVRKKLELSDSIKFSDVVTKSKDKKIKGIIEYSGKVLGAGIVNLINTYNPEAIVLGGIVPTQLEDFRNAATEYISENIFSNYAHETPIYLSDYDKEQIGIGSVALVINNIFKSIEI